MATKSQARRAVEFVLTGPKMTVVALSLTVFGVTTGLLRAAPEPVALAAVLAALTVGATGFIVSIVKCARAEKGAGRRLKIFGTAMIPVLGVVTLMGSISVAAEYMKQEDITQFAGQVMTRRQGVQQANMQPPQDVRQSQTHRGDNREPDGVHGTTSVSPQPRTCKNVKLPLKHETRYSGQLPHDHPPTEYQGMPAEKEVCSDGSERMVYEGFPAVTVIYTGKTTAEVLEEYRIRNGFSKEYSKQPRTNLDADAMNKCVELTNQRCW